jgi:glycosyltransferase involved in cell wall biosynthesis
VEIRGRRMKRKPRVMMLAASQSSHTRLWLKGLTEANCEVIFPVFRKSDLGSLRKIKGIRLVYVKWEDGWWNKLLFPFRIRSLIAKCQPDLIHAQYITGFGWVAAFITTLPKVITIWGSDLFVDMNKPGIGWLNRMALKKADLITVHSVYLKKILVEQFGLEENKIHMGGFGVDRRIFKETKKPINKIKKILHLRPMEDLYQPKKVVKAFLDLAKTKKNVKLIMPLYRAKKEIHEEIQRMINEKGMEDRIVWQQEMTPKEWAALLSEADLGISLANSDGMPITLWEAMACGLAPVMSNLSVYKGFLEQNVNALLVDRRGGKPLELALSKLLRNSRLRNAIAKNNLEKIKEVGDLSFEMKKIRERYFELLSETD